LEIELDKERCIRETARRVGPLESEGRALDSRKAISALEFEDFSASFCFELARHTLEVDPETSKGFYELGTVHSNRLRELTKELAKEPERLGLEKVRQ
jgi:hypothetical protein